MSYIFLFVLRFSFAFLFFKLIFQVLFLIISSFCFSRFAFDFFFRWLFLDISQMLLDLFFGLSLDVKCFQLNFPEFSNILPDLFFDFHLFFCFWCGYPSSVDSQTSRTAGQAHRHEIDWRILNGLFYLTCYDEFQKHQKFWITVMFPACLRNVSNLFEDMFQTRVRDFSNTF